jgi:hypothetical protein
METTTGHHSTRKQSMSYESQKQEIDKMIVEAQKCLVSSKSKKDKEKFQKQLDMLNDAVLIYKELIFEI